MTANEIAQEFIKKGLVGEYLSQKQGEWLFSQAQKEGLTDSRGQRTAVGNGWKLVRDQSRWLLLERS